MTTAVVPPPTARRRRRRRLFACVLAAIVAGTTAVAFELWLCLFWVPDGLWMAFLGLPLWREPEPGQWEPIPGFANTIPAPQPPADDSDAAPSADGPTRQILIRTNSLGCRGPELEPRQPGELRVLFAGDSLVFGHYVPEAESFAFAGVARAAALLQRPITVCNAGVPGYGFEATRRRVHRLAPRVAPDAIVVGLCISNDFLEDIEQSCSMVIAGRLIQGPFARSIRSMWRANLAARSRLWLFAECHLFARLPSLSLVGPKELSQDEKLLVAGLPGTSQAMAGLYLEAIEPAVDWPGIPRVLQHFADQLADLRQLAGTRPLLLLLNPNRCHLDAEMRSEMLRTMGMKPERYRAGLAQQRILDVCSRVGVAAFDLTPVVAAGGPVQTLFMSGDHVHFTARGNAVVAEAVGRRLADELRGR